MPKINYTILPWARETAQFSLEDAANKLQIKSGKLLTAEEKLIAYENGEKEPSRSMLLQMTRVYRRPLLTFYLDKPPLTGDRGEDFRTLPDQYEAAENMYVDVLIRNLKACQSTIRETLIDEDEEIKLDFVGKNTIDQGVDNIVQTLRDVINIDISEFRSQSNYGDAFKTLRRKIEQTGIFILLKGNLGSYHTNIAVSVFRGFALSDDVAPFIVINDLDAKSAWSFTLLHEMTHLLLGQTGVSGAYEDNRVEKLCNEVASEFLLPSFEFENFRPTTSSIEKLTEQISQYAFLNKISSSHISYRLYRRGDIDKKLWKKLQEFYYKQWLEQRDKEKLKYKEKEGGPNPYILRKYQLGSLVNTVQRFTSSGALSTTKAGMLLGIKPLKVHRLFETGQLA